MAVGVFPDFARRALASMVQVPAAVVRPARERLCSLDVLRGLALVGMVFVNATGAAVWPQLGHAEWNGLTFADVVFPAFLFAMGASMALGRPPTAVRVVRRVVVLVALGILVNYLATRSPVRYPGVLQRIAFDFLLASIIIRMPRRFVAMVAAGLLVAYSIVLIRYGATPGRSLESTVDRAVFSRPHLLFGLSYDPEGVVSSVASLATVLIGYLCGDWIRRSARTVVTAAWLAVGALVLALLASLASISTPANKRLWTPSFTLVTGAICTTVLAVVFLGCDVGARRLHAVGLPFAVIGANSLVVYVGSELAAIGLYNVVTPDGPCTVAGCPTTTGYAWLFQHLFESWAGIRFGSLAFSLAFVGAFWLLAALLWRARIFIRA